MLKRTFDLLVASILLAALLPFFVVSWIAIRIDSRGSAIFRQNRIGLHLEEFEILKFRSMRVAGAGSGGFRTRAADPRVTRVGKLLRRTSVDELPQLLNVLVGDMSLVGPRPDVPEQQHEYRPEDWRKRHTVRPGITGLAQINGRSEITFDERLRYDLEYVDKHSIWSDFSILALTVTRLFARGTN